METYYVETRSERWTFRRRAVFAFGLSITYAAIMFCFDIFWRTGSHKTASIGELGVKAIFMGLFWGLCMAFVPTRLTKPSVCHSRLLVDDHSVTGISEHSAGLFQGRTFRRVVRRGHVRSIFEIKGPKGVLKGVGISERTKLGARMWGFVFVPASLPEFEDLRQLAESWKAPAKN